MNTTIHITITDEMLRPYAERLASWSGGHTEADIQQASDALRAWMEPAHNQPRYWVAMTGQVLRMPGKRPLIHNGRKPR